MTMNRLCVYWEQRLVGRLSMHKNGRVAFQYSKQWLDSDCKPISVSLPCQEKRHSPGVSTAFFENLLPESNARTILAFNNRFDKKDTFAFLEHFGEDCAGALTVLPESKEPDFSKGCYVCIDDDLVEILDEIERSAREKIITRDEESTVIHS